MPAYDYRCPSCNYVLEITHSIKEDPEIQCPECKKSGAVEIMKRMISRNISGFIFKTWTPSIAYKRSREQVEKRKNLGTKQLDRYGSGPRIKPNVEGVEVDSWSEAKKLAKEKGLNSSSYDAAIQKEKRTSKISGIDDRVWKKAKSEKG